MKKPLRVGIVGFQHNHIRTVFSYAEKTGAFEVVAIVDEDDFLREIQEGARHMELPPQEAIESSLWALKARDAADRAGRFVRDLPSE